MPRTAIALRFFTRARAHAHPAVKVAQVVGQRRKANPVLPAHANL